MIYPKTFLAPSAVASRLTTKQSNMGNQTDYFNRIGYKPKYFIGDRVFGKWNKIPFIGTVGNDRLINELEGPTITIQLDLPIKRDNTLYNIIVVKHRDIKKLIEY